MRKGGVEDGVVLLAKSGYSKTGTYLKPVGFGSGEGVLTNIGTCCFLGSLKLIY
jgi:hypothetical protein